MVTAPPAVPGPNTLWTVSEGDKLSVGAPVTLTWQNDAGLTFSRRIEIDEDFLFTISQSVANTSDVVVSLAPYGILARHVEFVEKSSHVATACVVDRASRRRQLHHVLLLPDGLRPVLSVAHHLKRVEAHRNGADPQPGHYQQQRQADVLHRTSSR